MMLCIIFGIVKGDMMMMNKFTLTRETMNKLECHSVDIEKLKTVLAIVDKMVWQDLMEADVEGENYQDITFRLGCMTDMLVEIVSKRDEEISAIINQIHVEKQEATA